MSDIPVIAIDGPGGAGKGELCIRLSKKYGFSILDSGAIYRVLAYAAIKNNIALDDTLNLANLAKNLNLEFKVQDNQVAIILDNENVSSKIRNEEIGGAASKVAVIKEVRAALLERQRDFKKEPGLLADGRDMGTVVFP